MFGPAPNWVEGQEVRGVGVGVRVGVRVGGIAGVGGGRDEGE